MQYTPLAPGHRPSLVVVVLQQKCFADVVMFVEIPAPSTGLMRAAPELPKVRFLFSVASPLLFMLF